MKHAIRYLFLLVALILAGNRALGAAAEGVRFGVMDVYVDSSSVPLAAYQLELWATNGAVKIVGIEGGEHAAFISPPFYDPQAMQQDRVIIAAFNSASPGKLPKGRTRVATIHFQADSNTKPKFETAVQTAASADGKRLRVAVSVVERNSQ